MEDHRNLDTVCFKAEVKVMYNIGFYVLHVCGAHPESGLQLDLAVCSRALHQEALVQRHVGGVEEAAEGQVQNTKLRLLLMLFDLPREHEGNEHIRGINMTPEYVSDLLQRAVLQGDVTPVFSFSRSYCHEMVE